MNRIRHNCAQQTVAFYKEIIMNNTARVLYTGKTSPPKQNHVRSFTLIGAMATAVAATATIATLSTALPAWTIFLG